MAPFRNPFNRKPQTGNGISINDDGNAASATVPEGYFLKSPNGSFLASRTSSGLSIKSATKTPDEFKMSVVNDSGVYLPPSPTQEKQGFWSRTPTSTTTSSHRSVLSENEPFSISRESFDSYRRSFDISARSPVLHQDGTFGRTSLDSRSPRTPRSARHGKFDRPQDNDVVDEEAFEDVGLNDEVKPKKRSLFARFAGDNNNESHKEDEQRPNSSHGRFHLPGRKRGQSGQGAELGSIPFRGQPSANSIKDETIA